MDRLESMRVFVRVVERASFSKAAADLGLPASTVSDAIRALEAHLSARLLERTTRQVRVTPDGEAFHARCVAILADVEDAERAVSGSRPRGVLRVNVQGSQARRFIVPSLGRFFDAYPDIRLEMTEGDRFVDLVREGVDCVLRATEPRDSDLAARRVATLPEVTVASRDYVQRHGAPDRWDSLAGHRMVGFHSSALADVMPLEFVVDGERKLVTLPMALSVDGADTYQAAARAGLGIIQVPRYSVAAEMAAGTLVELLPGTPPAPLPVYVLYPRSRQLSARVRVFIDWVAAEYAAAGW